MKKISIIIPAYNASKTIKRCLDSLLISNYTNFEVIIVDDGSSDDTAEVIESYTTTDSRVKLISQPNSGPSAARNNGLNHATGDIIAFADSDDYVEPNYFYEIAYAFEANGADVVYFEFARVDEIGHVISRHKLPDQSEDYYEELMRLSEADMFGYTWLKAFRKELLQDVRFHENMQLFEDEVFTCAALRKPVDICFLRKHLYNYVRSDSGSLARRTHKRYYAMCDEVYTAWKKLLEPCASSTDFLNGKARHFANVCKYYGLERNVNSLEFFVGLSKCTFFLDVEPTSPFERAIRSRRTIAIIKEIIIYKLKNLLLKIKR